HNALDEHLCKNRRPGSADRFANTDFADALVDACQHDVHNPDATDDKADSGDDATAHSCISDLLIDALQLIFLSAETKVFDAAVRQHENVTRLLKGRFELLEACHL